MLWSPRRKRLEQLVENGLDDDARVALKNLLLRDDTLFELAALKQDAKNFGYQMMVTEREKRATLAWAVEDSSAPPSKPMPAFEQINAPSLA